MQVFISFVARGFNTFDSTYLHQNQCINKIQSEIISSKATCYSADSFYVIALILCFFSIENYSLMRFVNESDMIFN